MNNDAGNISKEFGKMGSGKIESVKYNRPDKRLISILDKIVDQNTIILNSLIPPTFTVKVK